MILGFWTWVGILDLGGFSGFELVLDLGGFSGFGLDFGPRVWGWQKQTNLFLP